MVSLQGFLLCVRVRRQVAFVFCGTKNRGVKLWTTYVVCASVYMYVISTYMEVVI